MDDIDRGILAIEKRRYRYGGMKLAAVSEELGLTPGRYHQLLARLLSDPEALLAEPVLVRRLQRVQAARLRARGYRRTA